MKALLIGGTGLISTGIVKHLLGRGASVTVYTRGQRGHAHFGVDHVVGDRSDAGAFERTFERSRYDVVIDMICFTPAEAEVTARVFGGRCEHLEFCSTVCVYGVKVPGNVLVDERFPAEPTTTYARDKLACEEVFRRAADRRRFHLTILRPSHTYGPGAALIDQLEFDGPTWDRIARGQPVLCAGDGLGLWQSTHRDDCGKLFAHAALEARTFGEAYNATRDETFTWREYYRRAAAALDARARLVFVPAAWLLGKLPGRFSFLEEITQFHGAYSSAKARSHVPAFDPTTRLEEGARETFADTRRRGAWRDSTADAEYERLVTTAIEMGFPLVDA